MTPFVELRQKTEYSIGFACGRLVDHVARAKELGQTAVCLTERDTLRGVYDLHRRAGENDLRPVYGVEVALVGDRHLRGLPTEDAEALTAGVKGKREAARMVNREERRRGLDRAPTVVLRAMTDEGLLNLFRISSAGWLEGMHRRPRVDLEVLRAHADGVSASMGGPEGYATEAILRGDLKGAVHALDELAEVLPGRTYLEVHPHPGKLHTRLNEAVEAVARHRGLPVFASNDPRYALDADVETHSVTLCLQRRGMTFEVEDHPRSSSGYHLRTGDEVLAAFASDHPGLSPSFVRDAVSRTVEVAEAHRAKAPIDPLKVALPDLGLDRSPDAELRRLCRQGWEWRRIPERAARTGVSVERYAQQLVHELREIGGRRFDPYFLILRDVIGWARESGITVGPGRGSAAGSLVCYLLGITSIDPLEHGLMFERFLAPGRIDMPDIDTDFQKTRRDEVIEYLRGRYGADRVAHIATHGQMHGKGALKDVGRVMAVPFGVLNSLTASFSTKQGDEKIPVREVLLSSQNGRSFVEEYPHVMEVVERLEGSVRQIGVHASGVLVSALPLRQVCPMETHARKGSTTAISAIDMDAVSQFGLLKLDVLGLSHLDVIAGVGSAVAREGTRIDFESLTFDDQDVIDAFTRQEFTGVFQYDAASARNVCADLVFAGFGDVAALTALNRPGCTRSGLTEAFRRRRQDPDKIEPFHPIYDEITADTLGVLVYQEQVIRIFRDLGAFTPEEADKMRKIIGKKLGEAEMEKYRAQFAAGATARGMAADDVDVLFTSILKFAEYGFNRAHAASYAAIGYWEMWAKVHHPREFMWSLMVAAKDSDEAMGYVGEARRLGVVILGPDVSESGPTWTLTEAGIRAGIGSVKNVGKSAVQAIVAGQPYRVPSEFFERVPGRAVNTRHLDSLIRSGVFRSLFPNTRYALERADEWREVVRARKEGWEAVIDRLFVDSALAPDYSETDLLALALSVSPQSAGAHPMELYRELFDREAAGVLSATEWLALGAEDFWDHAAGYVAGVVVDVKFRAVGDFDRGDKLTDEEKARKGWGRRYASVTLQDGVGGERRMKVDPDAFDAFGALLERGKGLCIAAHVDILGSHHSVRAHYLADLEAIRQKVRLDIPLTPWEKCFTGEAGHPVIEHSRRTLARHPKRWEAVGMVTHVRKVIDRNSNEMAFFGLQDGYGIYLEAVAFHDEWEQHGEMIRPGAVICASLNHERKRSYVLTEEGITAELCVLPSQSSSALG